MTVRESATNKRASLHPEGLAYRPFGVKMENAMAIAYTQGALISAGQPMT
jgi:hypothetical protein